jgi:Skp family chaperone for outer membrane proteins
MFKKLMFCLAMGMFSLGAFAQGTKVAVVDADVVIQQSKKGKAFFEDYQAFRETRQKDIETKVEEFRSKESDFQAKAASMSEDKRKESRLDLERLRTDIQRAQEDAQREMDRRLQQALDQFRKELAPLISQIAVEQGLDMVFNYGPQSNMVYFSDAVNITDAVIKKWDEMPQ